MTQPLPASLRAAADGLYPLEAATGLIIAHGTWLDRGDFARFVHHGAGTAAIEWEAAIAALIAVELLEERRCRCARLRGRRVRQVERPAEVGRQQ